MADQKISELTALTGANVADDDAIAIVDTSATETKKIVFSELKNALDTATGFVRITGDTMTGALDVQSTITSDGLTVDGVASIQPSSASIPSGGNTSADDLIIQSSGHTGMTIGSGTSSTGSIYFADSGSNSIGRIQYNHTDNSLYLQTNAEKRLNISSGGDISFYEDTGTTAKLFWDASAESLGIGTTSPSAKLHSNVGAASTTGVLAENANDAASTGDLIKAYSARGNTSAYNLFKAENSTGVKFLVSGDGNVGIGTDAPSTPLHVVDPSTSYVFAETTGTGTSAGFRLKGDASADYTLFTTQGTNQFAIYDNAAAAERMRIDSSGNLLVANTTGASADTGHIFAPTGVAFHVRDGGIPLVVDRLTNDGDLQLFRKDGSTVGSIGSNTTSGQSLLDLTATQNFRLLTNGSERMRIDSSGRVMIGNTVAGSMYSSFDDLVVGSGSGDVGMTIYSGSAAGTIAFADSASGDGRYRGWLQYTHDTEAMTFATSATERMRIDSNGNVGIGVTPLSKLHIEDTSGAVLTLGNSQNPNDVVTGTVFGRMNFYASDRSGTTSTGGVARIEAIASAGYSGSTPSDLLFYTHGTSANDGSTLGNPTERMRIDSSGNLILKATSDTGNRLQINGADETSELLEIGITSGHAQLTATHASGGANTAGFIFRTRGGGSTAERMRITSAGELLVGTTSTILDAEENEEQGVDIRPEGFVKISRSSNHPLQLARTDAGELIKLRSNEVTVGSIGVNSGTYLYITNPQTNGGGISFGFNSAIMAVDNAGAFADNSKDVGSSSVRFDDIYATNGTIQTSDRNEKQDIAELSDAEQRVAVAAKGLLRKFRWKDAVAEKGDEARTHFGIIAQDLQAAFAAEGLDAGDYAMFISSTWTDEETGEERTRMGVRYSELLAFIIAAI